MTSFRVVVGNIRHRPASKRKSDEWRERWPTFYQCWCHGHDGTRVLHYRKVLGILVCIPATVFDTLVPSLLALMEKYHGSEF